VFVVVAETFLDDFVTPEVEGGESLDGSEIGDFSGPEDLGVELDFDVAGRVWSGKGGKTGEFEALSLFVEAGREKQEFLVLKLEARTALGDAAFPEKKALGAMTEGLTNECPFLKTDAHASYDVRGEGGTEVFFVKMSLF
jgi:hypothetical protein